MNEEQPCSLLYKFSKGKYRSLPSHTIITEFTADPALIGNTSKLELEPSKRKYDFVPYTPDKWPKIVGAS